MGTVSTYAGSNSITQVKSRSTSFKQLCFVVVVTHSHTVEDMSTSRLCSRFPAGWTVRFHHDVVQVRPGLSHFRENQSQPFLRPRACLCATAWLSPYLVCCSVPFAIAYVSRGGSFVKLCLAKCIVDRKVRFVRALDHSPTTTSARTGETSLMQFIHIRTARSCDELLPSPFVPGRRSRMARRRAHRGSQFRAPLPACALPSFFCCVDAVCTGTNAGLRIPPRRRKYYMQAGPINISLTPHRRGVGHCESLSLLVLPLSCRHAHADIP